MRETPSKSVVTPARVHRQKQGRFNPIRNLNPENLARMIDGFHAGNLREFALMMEAIESRDDVLQCVAPKRRKAVAQRGWEVLLVSAIPEGMEEEARKHQQALKRFYRTIQVSNAADRNVAGGFSLLARQMLDCIGKRFAVHEVRWEFVENEVCPVRAHLQFVPLWFFENRTGRLRFLTSDSATDGVDLEEGGWMVTVGEGIMEACAVAYMFKRLAMQDWLHYCEKHGTPGVQGKTGAEKGSPEWNNLRDAVEAISNNFSCITSYSDTIEKLDLSTSGELPYPVLVERIDRRLAALWRGADLSTMSAGGGAGDGASLQGQESQLLERDDAGLVAETLQRYLDRRVIEYAFGPGVEPLAYIELRRTDADGDDMHFRREVFKGFLSNPTTTPIIANLLSLKELNQAVGLPLNPGYEEPYLPVRDAAGQLVTGEPPIGALESEHQAQPPARATNEPAQKEKLLREMEEIL